MISPTSTARPGVALALILGWALLGMGGLVGLVDRGARPGAPAAAAATWPEGAGLDRHEDLPTLLLFAHPRCPCTQASLRMLERLAAQVAGRADLRLVAATDPAWDLDGLRAEQVPGLTVVADPGGRMASAFGARTSGQVMLFSADGLLLFAGGITPARGHEGPSLGSETIRALLLGEPVQALTAPVHGCQLSCDPEEAAP